MDQGEEAVDYRARLLRGLTQRIRTFLESDDPASLTETAAVWEPQALVRLGVTQDVPLAAFDVEAHLTLG